MSFTWEFNLKAETLDSFISQTGLYQLLFNPEAVRANSWLMQLPMPPFQETQQQQII